MTSSPELEPTGPAKCRLCSLAPKGWTAATWGTAFYLFGNAIELALGGLGDTPTQVASALVFFVAAAAYSLKVDPAHDTIISRYEPYRIGCALSLVGMVLASVASISGFIASLGFIAYIIGELFGVFYKPMEKNFSTFPDPVLRTILGKPKDMMGYLTLGSKAPLLIGALVGGDWGWVCILVCWGLGDLMVSGLFSKALKRIPCPHCNP